MDSRDLFGVHVSKKKRNRESAQAAAGAEAEENSSSRMQSQEEKPRKRNYPGIVMEDVYDGMNPFPDYDPDLDPE
ncbi:hypothetical protein [Streptomyces sp. NPDC058751]|uniref:hypothetical protein n=1 Tax=Streptomyces sp. NPDC058751 TaxID=3346623 RepID=UPI0036C5933E